MGDPVLFDLPPDTPPDLKAMAILTQTVDELRAALAELARRHAALAQRVTARRSSPPGADGQGGAGVLRWRDLDRATAIQVWQWLIGWTGWFVIRYDLQEELPACWPHHGPLVEELTGLCGAWHVCTDEDATADALLRWHEALARFRVRIRDWDDTTKCRNGRHSDRRIDLRWPDEWKHDALAMAAADASRRPASHRLAEPAEPGTTEPRPAEPPAAEAATSTLSSMDLATSAPVDTAPVDTVPVDGKRAHKGSPGERWTP